MSEIQKRALKVFLCHASGDKPAALSLYAQLKEDGADPWLDKKKLLPGQDFEVEIRKAIRETDAIIVCLSQKSVNKEGFVQKEIKMALDFADEKLDETIYIIPARVEEVELPARLSHLHWVDLFADDGYEWLRKSLTRRARQVGAEDVPSKENFPPSLDCERIYLQGIGKFYAEQWQDAIYYFQSCLSQCPNYKDAKERIVSAQEKLAEAEKEKQLAELYHEAALAQEAGEWQTAIVVFKKMLALEENYKDVRARLQASEEKSRLAALYQRAEKLSELKEWGGVLGVFREMDKISPKYPDPLKLRKDAEKNKSLDSYYTRALKEIEKENWHGAEHLLKQVQKIDKNFRDTKALLSRIQAEFKKNKKPTRKKYWLIGLGVLLGVMILLAYSPAIGRSFIKTAPTVHAYLPVGRTTPYYNSTLITPAKEVFLSGMLPYVVCLYDISSNSYLIGWPYIGCDYDTKVGWLRADFVTLIDASLWDLFPYIQY